MSFTDFHHILDALGLDIFDTLIRSELVDDAFQVEHNSVVIQMTSAMFRDLPANISCALEDGNPMDGTDMRREWARLLQATVIKRIVHEVRAIRDRRSTYPAFEVRR